VSDSHADGSPAIVHQPGRDASVRRFPRSWNGTFGTPATTSTRPWPTSSGTWWVNSYRPRPGHVGQSSGFSRVSLAAHRLLDTGYLSTGMEVPRTALVARPHESKENLDW